MVRRRGERGPASRHELTIGVGKARRRDDGTVDQAAALFVAFAVEGLEPVGAEAPRLFQHGDSQVRVHILADVGHRFIEAQDMRQQEAIIVDRWDVAVHQASPIGAVEDYTKHLLQSTDDALGCLPTRFQRELLLIASVRPCAEHPR